jgi:hypothetical protein
LKSIEFKIFGKKLRVQNFPYSYDQENGLIYELYDYVILEDYVRKSSLEILEIDFEHVKETYKGIGIKGILDSNSPNGK